jgi:hypothetical protein
VPELIPTASSDTQTVGVPQSSATATATAAAAPAAVAVAASAPSSPAHATASPSIVRRDTIYGYNSPDFSLGRGGRPQSLLLDCSLYGSTVSCSS